MLRITVELLSGGRTQGRRMLAIGEIARTSSGATADYRVSLGDERLPATLTGEVRDYSRWSASIRDLVARAVCVGLSGDEALPQRPTVPELPIHRSSASNIPMSGCGRSPSWLARSSSTTFDTRRFRGLARICSRWTAPMRGTGRIS